MTATEPGPGKCVFTSDDPGAGVRISVFPLKRGAYTSTPINGPIVRVDGLGRGAAWYADTPDPADDTGTPATTAGTAPGTGDPVNGSLMLYPPGRLVVITVRGQFNNSQMAKDIARVVLDRL